MAVGLTGVLVSSAVVAWAAAVGPEPAVPGFPVPDAVTQWGLPASRAIRDGAATLTIGLLTVACVLIGPEGDRPHRLDGPRLQAVRLAALAASVWLAASIIFFVLTYSDLLGTSPLKLRQHEVLLFALDFDLGRSLAVSIVLVLVVTYGALLARGQAALGLVTVVAYGALLPLALTGHSASSSNHALAVDSQALHVIGVSAWVGGLLAIASLWTSLHKQQATVLRRFSRLAGTCFVVVAVSGIAGAAARLSSWSDLASSYGVLLGLKVCALVVVGLLGWRQRARVIQDTGAAEAGQGAFMRLAVVELVVLAVAMGLGVALSQTVPPVSAATLTATEALLGYPMPEPLTATTWVASWRIDWVWAPVALGLSALYLAGVARLRRRGDSWSIGRTIAWLSGWALLIWATSGTPGVYGRVLFSMHMVQHMTIAMAVPVLLVLGAPVTLGLRALRARTDGSRGAREWLLAIVRSRPAYLLGHPLVAPALLIGSLIVFYTSGLFELALRTHAGHVAMVAHFLIVGYLFASVICGIDPGSVPLAYPFRLLLLIATMGFHAFFGVAMMSGQTTYGGAWFSQLDRPWGPSLVEDQVRGGALAWAMGDYPVLILAIAMMFAWYRHDSREARRYDRQAERDGDAALMRYNEQLRGLSERGSS